MERKRGETEKQKRAMNEEKREGGTWTESGGRITFATATFCNMTQKFSKITSENILNL